MELIKLLSNPVRAQIVQYLHTHDTATSRDLCDALPDVPAPTMYRHISALLKSNVLCVAQQRQVRGATERLLRLNPSAFAPVGKDDLAQVAYHYLMELYGRFELYARRPNADPVRDRLSLRTRVLTLTDEQTDALWRDLAALLDRYDVAGAQGRKRSFSFISAPTGEENDHDD